MVIDYLPDIVKTRLSLDQVLADKASDRFSIWAEAIQIFKTSDIFRMIFGYGIANFPLLHLGIYGEYVGTHNLFVQSLLEGGLTGLLLIISIFVSLIKKILINQRWIIFGAFIATIVMSCSLETINKKFLWNMLIFSIVYVYSKKEKRRKYESICKYNRTNIQS